jgi:pilus assembly protein Flp/PilA
MVKGRAVERLLQASPIQQTLGGSGMEFVRQFIHDEDGQDVVEYGLLIATIAIVVLVGISFFGNNISAWFNTLAGRITTTGVS